jgi:hypothetical protein
MKYKRSERIEIITTLFNLSMLAPCNRNISSSFSTNIGTAVKGDATSIVPSDMNVLEAADIDIARTCYFRNTIS